MLNDKVRKFLLNKGWLVTDDDKEYDSVISNLAIPYNSSFADFQRYTTECTFSTTKGPELINICWFSIYSGDFKALTNSLWKKRPGGNLPQNYIPFSNRSGDSILLYDKINQGIYYVNELEISELIKGKFNPQWDDFNEFLEWYFDIN
ncbi:hypothetical protein [Lysinibacillus sp. JNUCC-52]|uniref:hypothetical protein n=1 Tax=Lysinibacillus sp. JNUCC-52 TaxID=2792480 RepID=UPI001934B86B|nr:hypothetical protein JNUCC52_22125 [Lysinibacillus sp. JNUCC-52]